jgi:hypothetical protein
LSFEVAHWTQLPVSTSQSGCVCVLAQLGLLVHPSQTFVATLQTGACAVQPCVAQSEITHSCSMHASPVGQSRLSSAAPIEEQSAGADVRIGCFSAARGGKRNHQPDERQPRQ